MPSRSSRSFLRGAGYLLALIVTLGPSPAAARGLTFEERVAAEYAIEEVYWRHRIWPEENPGQKPPLATVLPDARVRDQVEDYLRQSNALAEIWNRPIAPTELQAELDRMVRETRDPEMLRELFGALGNDAERVAETLARRTLADRLIRKSYAFDERFHGALKRQAQAALLACGNGVSAMQSLAGDYTETTFVRRVDGTPSDALLEARAKGTVDLSAEEWKVWLDSLGRRFGSAPETIPLLRASGLQEDADRFFVTAVLSRGDQAVSVATVAWPKRSFDAWWSVERGTVSADVPTEPGAYSGYSMTAPLGDGCADDAWERQSYAPTARWLHTAVWTGTEMIVWGGFDESYGVLNTGGRYDPATDTWTPTSTGTNLPDARVYHTAVWTGTEMIVWGGAGGGADWATGGRYDPATDTWTPTSTGAAVPSAREHHTAVWTGTEMIVWGGYSGSVLNTGGRYNAATNTWAQTSVGVDVPGARFWHIAVWTGTEMIVWGGYSGSVLNTGGRYNAATNTWAQTSVGVDVPAGRYWHAAVWTGTEMIVWGGYGGVTDLNTGGRYDPTTNTWSPTSTGADVPSARSDHSAVWTGTQMIVWGGFLNNGGRYDPTANTWTPTSTGPGVPSARGGHSAVWTGTQMIVWGGDGGTFLDTGGRYTPATDTWTATLDTEAPGARTHHTAVWTGAEMIVWGGGDYLNTGGRYDPATDTWRPTSTGAHVPGGRNSHTAVWTGTEMIVWGGTGISIGSSGGRYNPLTDTWAPTSTGANVPVPRTSHTAVWAGTKMIVWGGQWNGGTFNTGGRYDPATDTWTPTSTGAGVPAARLRHTVVWTGTEMLVWGGSAPGILNTGGRYDPATDAWTPTSTGPGVPSGRYLHTAVWTGTEMIVWGGFSDCCLLNTGGRYDPSIDFWWPTSLVPIAPVARTRHTAVWTGTEMIVWGGAAPGVSNTGGRYDTTWNIWAPTSTDANVPTARWDHTAVWTGSKMLVWGGEPLTNELGIYCACFNVYRDADGDGYGNPLVFTPSCDGSIPEGYVTNQTDCGDANGSVHPGASEVCNGIDDDCDGWVDDDYDLDGFAACLGDCDEGDASTYPGAAEINDGIDNQCPGDAGYGVADEIAPGMDFDETGGLSWPAQPSATSYQYARSTTPQFSSNCLTGLVASTAWPDPGTPPPGVVFCYLVRAVSPWLGSWGQASDGTERSVSCVGETACADAGDDDGDGLVDCLDPDCDGVRGCEVGAELTCTDDFDNDADGVVDCLDPDCATQVVNCTEATCDGIGGCEFGSEQSCSDGFDNDGDGLADCADAECVIPPSSSSPISQSAVPGTSSQFTAPANAWDGNPGTFASCSYAWPVLPSGSCGGQFRFATAGPVSGRIEFSVSHVFQACSGSETEAYYSLNGGSTWVPFVDVSGSSSTQTLASPHLGQVDLGALRVRVLGKAGCIPPGGDGTTGTIRLYELRFAGEGGCLP